MKKTIILMLCFVFVIFALIACNNAQTQVIPSAEPEIIEIFAEGYKSQFNYGENFSSAGLRVTASFNDGTSQLVASQNYKIDSSKFNSYIPGDYEITVTLITCSFSVTYNVKVLPKEGGETVKPSDFTKKLRILMIGNSFSEDVIEYAWNIAYELGVEELITGNAYIGGASLATHASRIADGTAVYSYAVNQSGSWIRKSGYTLKSIIEAEEWDIVTMQQSSTDSGVSSKYGQNLFTVENFIKEHVKNKNVKLAWHMTWAYPKANEFLTGILHNSFPIYNNDQMQMYSQIVSVVNSVIIPSELFYTIIPTGTAVQNLRTTSLCARINRDDCHLSIPLGRFVGAMTLVAQITGLDISKLGFRPTNMSLTNDEFNLIVKSVESAIINNFDVINIS